MVLRSHWTATVCTVAALALAGCSAPETAGDGPPATDAATASDDASTGTATDAAGEVATPAGPEVRATAGAVVDGFPAVLAALPDAEVVNSAVEPAGDGQPVVANITMRAGSSEDDVLKFYADHLGEAGFDAVGEPASDGGITTQSYHADEADQLVSVSIAPDTGGDDALLVTVGGRVLP